MNEGGNEYPVKGRCEKWLVRAQSCNFFEKIMKSAGSSRTAERWDSMRRIVDFGLQKKKIALGDSIKRRLF